VSELNRRDMMRVAAAGAAGLGGAAAAGNLPVAARRSHPVALRAALQRAGCPAGGDGLGPVCQAVVRGGRSWDSQVHLELADGRCGLWAPDARGYALAAAAQAAGRPVFVRCWGHEPHAEHGVGRFAGVVLALDACELEVDETAEVQS
jgi:hypothetical protein